MKTNKTLYNDQKGLVSIIVTMVLIILMTLVVLAMSQNSNREQRQALDRQLSDQAFYNAESGINDWADYLYSHPSAPFEKKNNCETDGAKLVGYPAGVPVPNIDNDTNKYTCILYDKAPPSVVFDVLSISDSKVVPIQTTDTSGNPIALKQLKFEWSSVDTVPNLTGCNLTATSTLPKTIPNCTVGGLRMDLIKVGNSRDNIIDNNYTAYVLPGKLVGALAYAAGRQGEIGQAICSNATKKCNFTLNVGSATPTDVFTLHLESLYKDNKAVTITGLGGTLGTTPVRFNNAQIMIDSTGKANDVLRRVQVRIPAATQYDYPKSSAIKTTQSVCKLITVTGPPGAPVVNSDARCSN